MRAESASTRPFLGRGLHSRNFDGIACGYLSYAKSTLRQGRGFDELDPLADKAWGLLIAKSRALTNGERHA